MKAHPGIHVRIYSPLEDGMERSWICGRISRDLGNVNVQKGGNMAEVKYVRVAEMYGFGKLVVDHVL